MRHKTLDKALSLTNQSKDSPSAFRCAKHTHTCRQKLFIHCLEIVLGCAKLEWQTFFSLSFSFKYVGWQRITDEHESRSTVHALLSPQKVQHHHADEKEHGRTSRGKEGVFVQNRVSQVASRFFVLFCFSRRSLAHARGTSHACMCVSTVQRFLVTAMASSRSRSAAWMGRG